MAKPPYIPILTYHQIEQAPPRGTPMRSLYVSPGSFYRQMFLLKILGYRGLSMSELMPYLRGEKSGRVVGITFDDGYLNNLEHAAPVLMRFGFSSTCYVVNGLMGQTNSWDAPLGVPSSQLMNERELGQWLQAGQEIGSHTLTHRNLLQLEERDQQEEIVRSKSELERRLGTQVNQFCYPYGDYDSKCVSFVRAAGYAAATTTHRSRVVCSPAQGRVAPMREFELPRVPIVRSTSWLQFLLKIATSYEDRHAN